MIPLMSRCLALPLPEEVRNPFVSGPLHWLLSQPTSNLLTNTDGSIFKLILEFHLFLTQKCSHIATPNIYRAHSAQTSAYQRGLPSLQPLSPLFKRPYFALFFLDCTYIPCNLIIYFVLLSLSLSPYRNGSSVGAGIFAVLFTVSFPLSKSILVHNKSINNYVSEWMNDSNWVTHYHNGIYNKNVVLPEQPCW